MYDREYLHTAIPASAFEGTDPQGLLEGEERDTWNDGYESVLAVIRSEFLAESGELEDSEITEAVLLANDAWDEYCGNQGDADATIEWVRQRLAPRKPGRPSEMTGGKRRNIYLDDENAAIAERLGNGNVSEGIRIALAACKQD